MGIVTGVLEVGDLVRMRLPDCRVCPYAEATEMYGTHVRVMQLMMYGRWLSWRRTHWFVVASVTPGLVSFTEGLEVIGAIVGDSGWYFGKSVVHLLSFGGNTYDVNSGSVCRSSSTAALGTGVSAGLAAVSSAVPVAVSGACTCMHSFLVRGCTCGAVSAFVPRWT